MRVVWALVLQNPRQSHIFDLVSLTARGRRLSVGLGDPSELLVAHVTFATTKHVFVLSTIPHALRLVVALLVIQKTPLQLHHELVHFAQWFVYLERDLVGTIFVLHPHHIAVVPLTMLWGLAVLDTSDIGAIVLALFRTSTVEKLAFCCDGYSSRSHTSVAYVAIYNTLDG